VGTSRFAAAISAACRRIAVSSLASACACTCARACACVSEREREREREKERKRERERKRECVCVLPACSDWAETNPTSELVTPQPSTNPTSPLHPNSSHLNHPRTLRKTLHPNSSHLNPQWSNLNAQCKVNLNACLSAEEFSSRICEEDLLGFQHLRLTFETLTQQRKVAL
jgi:hypothetical protein